MNYNVWCVDCEMELIEEFCTNCAECGTYEYAVEFAEMHNLFYPDHTIQMHYLGGDDV